MNQTRSKTNIAAGADVSRVRRQRNAFTTQRRSEFGTALQNCVGLCLALCFSAAEAAAQDWLRSGIVRGQEPEFRERSEVESPFADHLETDRDSFTPSTSTVDRSRWIVESSYSFIDNRRTAETHSLPELLLRFGLSDWLELRLGGNYEVGGEGADVSGGTGNEPFEGGAIARETQVLYGMTVMPAQLPSTPAAFHAGGPGDSPQITAHRRA